MNMVFGWSGLMIFVEFMNEMRRPYEFVKSFCAAEALVMLVYLVYGCYVYGLQGQYTLPVAFQGVSSYTWQSIGNGYAISHPRQLGIEKLITFQSQSLDIHHGFGHIPQYRRQSCLLVHL